MQDPRLILSESEQISLSQILNHFKNLQELILPTVANTVLLESIAKSMPNLKLLDISCSTNVTDYGITSLVTPDVSQCHKLEQLFLDGTSITTDGVLILLVKLPLLETVESSLLERALDMVPVEKNTSGLNLRKITVGRFWRGSEVLQNLPDLCPKLCQIILPNLGNDECYLLQKFQKLPSLVHVYIGQVKFENLLPVLPYFGQQLKTFSYSNFTETVNLTPFIDACHNLECLGINAGSVHFLNFNEKIFSSLNLSELRLNIHALIPQLVWSQFLVQCPNLLYLDITPAENLNDNTLNSILQLNQDILSKLRSFVVRGRHCGGDVALTEKTVENLIKRCLNIKCIGDCSTWSVQPENICEFIRF